MIDIDYTKTTQLEIFMDLELRKEHLPDIIQDLAKYVLVGREAVKAIKAELNAMKKLEVHQWRVTQRREEAQILAGDLLDAEAKIGQILKTSSRSSFKKGGEKSLPEMITHKQSYIFQQLAENMAIIEQVKADAREQEDLPTRTEVLRRIKLAQVEKRIAELKKRGTKKITDTYDVIVIDPPWPIEKIERKTKPLQVKLDYPTMTIDEILNIRIPHNNDCHMFLWCNQKYLPTAFDIIKEWNFNYCCTFVWHKNGGFQPFHLPMYNCEFVIYARIGNPLFTSLKDFKTCFNAERTGHSKKPEEFYEMLRRVTAGKRLDMFGRRKIEGFDSYGYEAN